MANNSQYAQGGPPQMHAPSFQNIPGLQQVAPAPPHVNHTSYSQNSQQPSNSPFAWTSDPAALFALFQASQAGYPQPFHHAYSFPPPPLPQASQLREMSNAFPPQYPQSTQPTTAVAERIHEVMDSDKEDGEVSEGEIVSQPSARNMNGRARPEPPRSVPQATHATRHNEEAYNPDQPAAGQTTVKGPLRRASQQAAPPTPIDPIQHDRDQAKQFVKLLHSNNMGYRTLANESLDLELLRGLYQSLNLPSEPAPILPPKTNAPASKLPTKAPSASSAVQPVSSAKPQQQKPIAPAVKTDVKPPPPGNAAASPVVDRREYIARLQAAKLAKQAGPSKPSPPQNTPPTTVAPPVQTVNTTQPVETSTAKLLVTNEQRAARQNEILRQRLEAMRAKKQPTPVATDSASVPSHVQKFEQTRPAVENTTQPARSGPSTPHKKSPIPSFPGIPGLFMNPSPPVNDQAAAATIPASSVPQKRPVPSDFRDASTPRGSVTPCTQPLSVSPHDYEEELIVIETSDNENKGSDMEIDEDQLPARSAVVSPLTAGQRQPPGDFANLPPHPNSAISTSSAVSTPGAQTPATQVREEELRKQEEKLAAARERVRKQFAEKRERDRAAAAAAVTATRAASLEIPMPSAVLGDSSTRPQTPVVESNHSMSVALGGLFNSVSDEANDLIRDVKRRRREEIQSELPTFDAELAKNVARMAQLTKEMEQLRAQNEKIAEDKKRLTYELESLGIDTEGMSHAEMRRMKDDMEHEQLPEVGASPQRSKSAVQYLACEALDSSLSYNSGDGDQSRFEDVPDTAVPLNDSTISAKYAALPELVQDAQQAIKAPTGLSLASIADVTAPSQDSAEVTSEAQPLLPEARVDHDEVHAPTIYLDDMTTSATPLDEEEFYSPAPAGELILDGSLKVDETLAANPGSGPSHGKSASEEGEVEMSESEEEYEPEEPFPATGTPVQDAPDSASQVAHLNEMSDITTEDEEAYEPPDIDEGMSDAHTDTEEHSAGAYEPQAEAGDGAMDIASSSSDDSDSDSDSSSNGEITIETGKDETISANHALHGNANIADDLAPELQPELAPASLPLADEEAELIRFTPYESPLRMFKSYRYHPNFAQSVTGGFLSPTFSHQIDAEKPFCQYETAGGSCNDPECVDQHFRGVGITGETLLVQLGTANPGKTTEEKQQWNDGLRGVLKELRKKSIKDPNGIAAEIAKYRREFLNDDTRVVNL